MPAIVWFRQDLRLADNPALTAARRDAQRILPLYIHAPHEAGRWAPGAASDWWLHHSLSALDASLCRRGVGLQITQGDSLDVLRALCRRHGVRRIHANRLLEPPLAARDEQLRRRLAQEGIDLQLHDGATLLAPQSLGKQDGTPYRMFTPFWRALKQHLALAAPLPAPARLAALEIPNGAPTLDALGLLPTVRWDQGFYAHWQPGEKTALHALKEFIASAANDYATARDHPDRDGSSRLSPHLHFGEISPRQVWWALHSAAAEGSVSDAAAESYLREIGWREFAYYVLRHFPHTAERPMDARFERFPWQSRGTKLLCAWQQGRTGIPIVDAGMRQLWHTGWMHNRVRMIAASFLTKNCLIDWRAGARWFWDTLLDADLANNSLGWQWTAGCGVDAAPYFRIFNPLRQGEKFDPQGVYVRQWVPELARLDDKFLHQPWAAPPALLADAGIRLGETYPQPLVDLTQSRADALRAFATLKHL